MIINLVVAASENNVIGKDNKLLWHLPNDLAFFKNITWGMPVIMGRKTYASMGRPLKGRTNIVLSKAAGFKGDDKIIKASSIEEAIRESGKTDAKECYFIGGGEIYRLALPVANRIYLTRVHANVEGDAFFPPLNEKEWQLTSNKSFKADNKHAYPYSFQTWERK